MDWISEEEREIKLSLQGPAQFKFTRGSWDTEAEVIGTYNNLSLDSASMPHVEFEIESYIDYVE